MKKIFFILLLLNGLVNAQDKFFFANGTTKTGHLISINNEVVFFKKNDTAKVEQIKKSELVLIEDYRGTRYVLASKTKESETKGSEIKGPLRQNSLRLQPFSIFLGRLTFLFERLNTDQSIGYVFPLALTFDPVGVLYNLDSSGRMRVSGIKFITGMDVNFYLNKKKRSRFFMGPRLRYGTDILLQETEAVSLQTQFGWDFGRISKSFNQRLSFGFGFVRIISTSSTTATPNLITSWFSFNYSIGVRW